MLPAPPAAAQPAPRSCFARPTQAAWSTLTQGYNYSPAGYGPFGFAPLAQAFDPALAGAPPLYGAPPLPPAAYGPLGTGLTSSAIMACASAAGGIRTSGIDHVTPGGFPT